MKLFVLLLLIVLTVSTADIVSYEGFIGDYPVWLDIDTTSGEISGEYFYRNIGTPIVLIGERVGDSLFLEERVGDSVTGVWNCLYSGKLESFTKINGDWINSDTNSIFLCLGTNREYKTSWTLDELPFRGELLICPDEQCGDDDYENYYATSLTFYSEDISEYSVEYRHYSGDWVNRFVYDLQTQNMISIHHELDTVTIDSLYSYLNTLIQPSLDAYKSELENLYFIDSLNRFHSSDAPRSSNIDSMWIYEGTTWNIAGRSGFDLDTINIDSILIADLVANFFIFDSKRVFRGFDFKLLDNGVGIKLRNYYGINNADDFGVWGSISYADLDYFLKPNSPLKRLTTENQLIQEQGIE